MKLCIHYRSHLQFAHCGVSVHTVYVVTIQEYSNGFCRSGRGCILCTGSTSVVTGEWLASSFHIREVPGSNVRWKLSIPTDAWRGFSESLQADTGILPCTRSRPLSSAFFPIDYFLPSCHPTQIPHQIT
jgi:hypothetical protein